MSKHKELPTKHDLMELSLRGIVAYAARAARRVQPLFQPDARREISQEDVDSVERAITLAEHFAAHAFANLAEFTAEAEAEASVSRFTRFAPSVDARAAYASARAGHCAAAAYAAATYPTTTPYATTRAEAAARAAARAAADADYAARAAADDDYDDATTQALLGLNDSLSHDYERLLQLTTARFPALGDPIDLNQLGPLWPDGAPDWFSKSPQATVGIAHGAPSIVVAWNPELISEDEYARLVEMLGDLARAEGGAGITRLKSHGFGVPIGVGVPQ